MACTKVRLTVGSFHAFMLVCQAGVDRGRDRLVVVVMVMVMVVVME